MFDAERWSEYYRVHAVDIIGEPGLSEGTQPALDSDAHAQWLDDVLDALGVESAAFVGLSFGGFLALDYALRRPARVNALVLVSPLGYRAPACIPAQGAATVAAWPMGTRAPAPRGHGSRATACTCTCAAAARPAGIDPCRGSATSATHSPHQRRAPGYVASAGSPCHGRA
ncbi:alpha/beta hydrolase [Stenotrophomonas maltophilia]|nr:alpha/beta hydrolase [Stenotrophomonas maltophilia]